MIKKDYSSLFSKAVDVLVSAGFKKLEIAKALNFIKPNSLAVDHTAFTKLCNGSLMTYRKRTVESIYNDLIIHKEFKEYFANEAINIAQYDLIYIFYFWSNLNEIKPSILGININRPTAGRLIYLEKRNKSYYQEKNSHPFKLFEYKNSETLDILCNSKMKRSGATFLSIHLGNNNLEDLTVTFASYAGAMSTDQNQYCGIGVIQQIKKAEFSEFMSKLSINGVSGNIVNALYKKRLDVSDVRNEMYESIEALMGSQKEPLKLINGFWHGYFLRKLIDGPGDEGGIVRIIMQIKDSGVADIFFSETEEIDINNIIRYSGFFKFPISNSGTITVGEFQNANNINRLIMHLKPYSKKMHGIFSGWRTIDFGYFASPIYFERVKPEQIDFTKSNDEIITELIGKFKPARYHRSRTKDFENEITELKKIENKNLETVEKCLGL